MEEEMTEAKIKKLHSDERISLWENLPLNSPMAIFFEPSTYCNFSCCYCTHSLSKDVFESEVRKYSNMKMEVFEKALDQIKMFDRKVKLVEFSGVGEPLINKDTPKMIKMIREENVSEHIRLITNGVLLEGNVANSIIEARPSSLRISIQGMSSKKYREVCGQEVDFDKLVNNIEYFYNNKIDTELFIKNIDIALDEDDYRLFYDTFSNISDRMYVENIIQFFSKVDYDKILKNTDLDRYGNEKKKIEVCPNTFTALVINSEGDISMCGKEIAPIYLGNVMTTTLLDAWNSEKRREFLIMQLDKDRSKNLICKDCKIPSESLASDKDILDEHAQVLKSKFLK